MDARTPLPYWLQLKVRERRKTKWVSLVFLAVFLVGATLVVYAKASPTFERAADRSSVVQILWILSVICLFCGAIGSFFSVIGFLLTWRLGSALAQWRTFETLAAAAVSREMGQIVPDTTGVGFIEQSPRPSAGIAFRVGQELCIVRDTPQLEVKRVSLIDLECHIGTAEDLRERGVNLELLGAFLLGGAIGGFVMAGMRAGQKWAEEVEFGGRPVFARLNPGQGALQLVLIVGMTRLPSTTDAFRHILSTQQPPERVLEPA